MIDYIVSSISPLAIPIFKVGRSIEDHSPLRKNQAVASIWLQYYYYHLERPRSSRRLSLRSLHRRSPTILLRPSCHQAHSVYLPHLSPRRICWPFRAEQPQNAAHITHNLGIAYQLLTVRTGPHASKPVYHAGREWEHEDLQSHGALVHTTGTNPVATSNGKVADADAASRSSDSDADSISDTSEAAPFPDLRAEARQILRHAFGEDGRAKRARLHALREALLAESQGVGSTHAGPDEDVVDAKSMCSFDCEAAKTQNAGMKQVVDGPGGSSHAQTESQSQRALRGLVDALSGLDVVC